MIYHKIWNGPDLYFYNNYSNKLVFLNDTNSSELPEEEIVKLAGFLPREIENYSRRIEINDITVLKEDEDNFAILFADNGPGIPEDDLPYIFDKFRRAETKLQVYGSGLGLFICKVVAKLHGGSISVSNSEVGGAVFKTVFPADNFGKKVINNFKIE